jgi:hypothetical protein
MREAFQLNHLLLTAGTKRDLFLRWLSVRNARKLCSSVLSVLFRNEKKFERGIDKILNGPSSSTQETQANAALMIPNSMQNRIIFDVY